MIFKVLYKKLIYFFLTINFISILYFILFLSKNGYLPHPFIFDKSNTFMDLFNPLVFAYSNKKSAYNEFKAVYPPLVFLFLKFTHWVTNSSSTLNPYLDRLNSPYLIHLFISFYLLVPFYGIFTNPWNIYSKKNKILIYLLFVSSTPFLFAIERLNTLIIPLFFLFLFFSAKKTFSRNLFLSILINLKPYFIFFILFYFIFKKYRDIKNILFYSFLIYLISGVIFDYKNFYLILINIIRFSHKSNLVNPLEIITMPLSITTFSFYFYDYIFFLKKFIKQNISANTIELYKFYGILFFSILKNILSLFLFFYFLKKIVNYYENINFFLKNSKNETEKIYIFNLIFIFLFLAISNSTYLIGPYSLVYYIVFFPILMKGYFKNFFIVIYFLLFFPYFIFPIVNHVSGYEFFNVISYFSSKKVYPIIYLDFGIIARPIANFFMIFLVLKEIKKKCDIKLTNNEI
jgi:hypothetical protein